VHQDVDLAAADEGEVLRAEQHCELVMAHRGGVLQCLFDEAVGVEPVGRQPVELLHDLGSCARELDPQELAEQMVVAVPLAPAVEGDEEEVRPLEVGEHSLRVRRAEHRVAGPCREPVEDGRSQQEVPLLVLDGLEHLGGQVVGDVAMGRGELADAVPGLADPGKPQRRKADPCRPALGSRDEDLDVLARHGDAGPRHEQLVRLVVGEGSVLRAQFPESASGAQSAQPPARVGPGGDDHPGRGRQAFHRVGERAQASLRAHVVEVVEHDDDAALVAGDAVHELVDRLFDVRPRQLQPGESRSSQPGRTRSTA
jgi:hypothetical protein